MKLWQFFWGWGKLQRKHDPGGEICAWHNAGARGIQGRNNRRRAEPVQRDSGSSARTHRDGKTNSERQYVQ